MVLWDVLFADPYRFDYLNYLGAAILKHFKQQILSKDSSECLQMLQDLGDLDLDLLQK